MPHPYRVQVLGHYAGIVFAPRKALATRQGLPEMENAAFYIVSRRVGSTLEPAVSPRIYGTPEQARAVAYKLAGEAGEAFVVLKAIFEARPSVVQGFHLED